MNLIKTFYSCLLFVLAISIAFIITLTVAAPALAFHSEEHQDATRKALIGKAHPETVLSLINVSTIGDQGSANLNSASHYDNCAWGEGRNWILTHRQAAVDAAYRYYQNGRAADRQAAIENLGYVFHTTEDFYAHSNWIENNDARAIANLEGDKPSYWISGTWLLDSPKLCPIGTPDHIILNKDTPDRPGFKEAFTDAVLATQEQLERFKGAVRVAYPNQANAIIFKLLYSGKPLSYLGLFEYKLGDGAIGFDRVYSDPAYGSVETGRNKWKGDWTNIEPFQLNGILYLVEYKSSDGTIAFDRLRKDGADSSEVWRGKWSTGWTVIKPFTLNSVTYLVEYKNGDGTIAIDRINSNAQGSTEVWRGKWSPGWTMIEPFVLNNVTYLVEYKSGDGTIAIDRINSNAQGSTEVWRGRWSTGWTVIKPFILNGVTYLVEYKSGDGTIAIDRINSEAKGTEEKWRGKWSPGWKTIEPFVLNEATYLLEYKDSDGTIAIDRINSNEQGFVELWRSKWSTGWTIIKPLAQLDKFEFETQQ